MTEKETWALHFAIAMALVFPATVLHHLAILPTAVAVLPAWFMIGFAFGRERRDHEIKRELPARLWWAEWDIWNWSKDGRMDLLTFVAPCAASLLVIYAPYA